MSQLSENQSMENLEEVREKIQKQYTDAFRKIIESADIVIEVCCNLDYVKQNIYLGAIIG